jgi:imidazolonepropionase-like amidohydrolase
MKTARFLTLYFYFVAIYYVSLAQSVITTRPVEGIRHTNTGSMAFTGIKLYIRPEKVIDNGVLLIKNGCVVAAGAGIPIPKDFTVRHLPGYRIYPGLIDIFSDFGLPPAAKNNPDKPPVNNPKAGPRNANPAVKPENNVLTAGWQFDTNNAAELRKLGFTAVQVCPNDGIFRGTAALIALIENEPAAQIRAANTGTHLSFDKGTSNQEYPSSLMGAIALIRQTLLDAQWYQQIINSNNSAAVEKNLSLQAWNQSMQQQLPVFFETTNNLDIFRAAAIAREFGLQPIYITNGTEFEWLHEIHHLKPRLITSLNFPPPVNINSLEDLRAVSLQRLRHTLQAPQNPFLLKKHNIPFAFTLNGLKELADYRKKLQAAFKHGLTEKDALAAFTTMPALFIGADDQIGTLDAGKKADFIITDGPLFNEKTKVHSTFISGVEHVIIPLPTQDFRGQYRITLPDNQSVEITISGSYASLELNAKQNKQKIEKTHISFAHQRLSFSFMLNNQQKMYRFTATQTAPVLKGNGTTPEGAFFNWQATAIGPAPVDSALIEKPIPPAAPPPPITFPNTAYGFEQLPKTQTVLFQNVTAWTNTAAGNLKTNVLISNGKIAAVANNLTPPPGTTVINGEGKHLTTGIIDEHSHIAIDRGVNEGTQAVTAEVRIGDVIDPTDINIYRQLAGGVTTAQLLHGSANPIGGQSQLIKLRWGQSPEKMKFDAMPFIKFALGENVKQSNWGDNYTTRYPQTRMGVEQIIKDRFQAALEYRNARRNNRTPQGLPVRQDLELEAIAEILENKRQITCHSYVQSEVLMLIRLAEAFNFKINTFTHILEGFKLADIMKKHGANASTFADWWAYKYEVIDAIPYNTALLTRQDICTAVNSDDAEMGRRLNHEAAKAILYGNLSEIEAWKTITLNPAKILHIDHRVGTIEAGKDADLVLWNQHPLSVYARVLQTYVDGKLLYDQIQDSLMQQQIITQKQILAAQQTEEENAESAAPPTEKKHHLWDCQDIGCYIRKKQ